MYYCTRKKSALVCHDGFDTQMRGKMRRVWCWGRSVFYNDLFAFDMERRRWYHLALKKKRKAREKDKGAKRTRGGGGGGSSMVRYGDIGNFVP